jgi:GNAT superfamily N-acetyltransferase
MNRDELLKSCFGDADLAPPKKWLVMTEPDENDPAIIHTRAVVGLDYRRVLVRDSRPPGPGVAVSTTTIPVAALLHVCTDPAYRGLGYASALVLSAHEEAGAHRSVPFAAVVAPEDCRSFFERHGYFHPDGAPDGFLVCELGGRDPEWAEWPAGTVRVL